MLIRLCRHNIIFYSIFLLLVLIQNGYGTSNVFIANLDIEAKADSVLRLLTLEEKIALLHGNAKFSSAGVERLGLPELKSADGPTGVREEMERDSWRPLDLSTDSATFFPAGPGLSATWNRDLALRYGRHLGEETRARGKDILLGPSVNIMRTPLSGRNFEFFTEDPYLNAAMAVNYIKGLQSCDAAVCVKHYAVNNQERNRWRINVQMDERALREIYLPVYRAAVEAGALSFMGAYNKFRGWYLCENDYLLNRLLKEEWGFRGAVISDWGATHSTVDAALHGLDIEMGSRQEDYNNYYFADPLIKAVHDSEVPLSVIDDKARRVLYVMFSCRTNEADRQKGSLCTPEHFKTAYNVAAESIVLLKNSKSVLPLNPEKIRKLAVFGENATHRHAKEGFGAGVKTKYEITPLEGLKKKVGDKIEILYAQGYRENYIFKDVGRRWKIRIPDPAPDSLLIQEAVQIAAQADAVIIFAGSNRSIESEGFDRPDMNLPFAQTALIKAVAAANPGTVVVMIASAPYDLIEVEDAVGTLVWGWFNGSEAGTAMADVLFGYVNPSGKLPFTMPVRLEDSPAHALNAYPGNEDSVVYKEGILVGYRWFDTKQIAPLYCFGHGLSYTQFEYSSLKTDKKVYGEKDTIQVSLRIKNAGSYTGAETVQIYMHDTEASVMRPARELKGFDKVFLKPGEEKMVQIDMPVQSFAFFDEQSMRWVVEPGTFELMAGASSRDIRESVQVSVR